MANAYTHDQLVSCPECGFGPFIRNHFFTGKLMTARDFTDESRYHSERMRHHNTRLHGWGVVCGLKVKAHENEACHDRFVVIEPGTAIDCCGNEILITEAVTVELATLPAVADLIKKKVTEPSQLQICVSYQECPTEEVPVLYDECGCDEARCAPNRILSSFSVGAIVDGDASYIHPSHIPDLEWDASINPPNAKRVALDAQNRMMYAITSDRNVVYQVDTETNMVVGMAKMDTAPLNVAVSNKGDRLYVVTEPKEGAASSKRQLLILDTAKMEGSPVRKLNIPNSEAGSIDLAVTADNRLFAMTGKAGKIVSWPVSLNQKGKKVTAIKGTLGGELQGLVVSKDNKHAYAIDLSSARLVTVDVKDKTKIGSSTPVAALPAEAVPTGVALVSSTGPDLLAVVSRTQRQLYLVDAKNEEVLGRALLDHEPVAVSVSPGGEWAYVLEADNDHSYVQAVSLFGIQKRVEKVTGPALQVGDRSREIWQTPSGDGLYIPYDPGNLGRGGIGIIKVREKNCREILWRHLDGCPSCDKPNCIVLATIENYVAGFKVEDQTDPASDPAKDQEDKIARIDNRKGRKLLPSTAVLTELVECLLEQGCGDCEGTQGPPGDPGAGAKVEVEPPGDNCKYGGAKVTDGKGQVAYVCNGKPGMDGKDATGLETDLTRIKALSWKHDSANNPLLMVRCQSNYWKTQNFQGESPGIVIGFTRKVMVGDPNKLLVGDPNDPFAIDNKINAHHVFQAYVIYNTNESVERIQLRGFILPVSYTENPSGFINTAQEVLSVQAEGVAFILQPGKWLNLLGDGGELWVRLQGDFVIDDKGRAVDAEFVRAELETGDRPSGSDQGIQGGQFESWFWTKDKSL